MFRQLQLRGPAFLEVPLLRPAVSSGNVSGSLLLPSANRDVYPPSPQFPMFTRGFLDIHKFGNKEAIEKEKARLKDELNRGYFADIHEFNKHGGKVAMANKTLIPSVTAMRFPELDVNFADGSNLRLPIDLIQSGNKSRGNSLPPVTLICLAFRANSQVMTASWSQPILKAFGSYGNVQMFEVSFIDSWLLSLSPMKRLMLRIMSKPVNPMVQTVYSFGDHYDFRKKLNILNLLTGYAFLLDKFGRIRWQGFGLATEEEVASLVSCTTLLLDETQLNTL